MLNRVCITCIVMASCCGLLAAAGVPGLWLDVPFVKQDKDGCGAASIAMVMQYWDRKQGQQSKLSSDAVHIEQVLISHAAHGIFASDMERYFQQNGYATFTFTGDLDLLQHHLQKGRPLIVALNPGSHVPRHYVVVIGLDPESKLVLVNDPAERKLTKEDGATFEKNWMASGNWVLIAVPVPR